MPKLSDTQLVILSNAAARDDHAVLPLPDTLKAKGGAAKASLNSLLKKGLVKERRAKAKEPAWRKDGSQRYRLTITGAGLTAIGVTTDDSKTADAAKKEGTTTGAKPPSIKPGTKQALLVDLLSKPGGATIQALQGATGWLPHTVRAALSGLRKRGRIIDRQRDDDGVSVYVIATTGNVAGAN